MKHWKCALLFFLLLPTPVLAQQVTRLCVQGSSGNCVPVDGTAPLPVTTTSTAGGLTHAQTSVLASNLIPKASAGNLYAFAVSADSTLSGAAWWLMAFDATTLPGDGTVTPALCYAYPTGTTSASYSFPEGVSFTTGIVLGVSTNGCFTKAASVHAFISAAYQ